jgi:hypothetical protein
MKSLYQIKQEEVETTKNYSIREHKMNIAFYSVFKFLFSDTFSFLFIFLPLSVVAWFYDFNLNVCLGMVLVHPIIYFFVDRPLHKYFGLDEKYKEISCLIDVNKEIIEDKKKEVK